LRTNAPYFSDDIEPLLACLNLPCQETYRLLPRNPAVNQRTQHGDRVGRRPIKMTGHLAGGIEPCYSATLAQYLCTIIGGETPEGIGNGADKRVGETTGWQDRPRPVRFQRHQPVCGLEPVAAAGIEPRGVSGCSVVERDRSFQAVGRNVDQVSQFVQRFRAMGWHIRANSALETFD